MIDVKDMSADEIKNQIILMEQALVEKEHQKKIDCLNELHEVCSRYGFNLEDLTSEVSKKSKVAIKYRNPSNPAQTWTGRGRQPRWLSELIADGSDIDDCRV